MHIYLHILLVTVTDCINFLHIQTPPNPVEIDAIKRLLTKKESKYACSLRDAFQPLVQQLAYYYCDY